MRFASGFTVLTTLVLGSVPVKAQQSVVTYQAPDGTEMQVSVGARFPKAVQRLTGGAPLAPGLPVLHQDSASHGKIASVVKGDKLIVWHARAGKSGNRGSTHAIIRQRQANQTAKPITPIWWPRLTRPWVRRAIDQNSVTTTLMGWTNQSIAATRSRIVAAARRGGLSTSELGQGHNPTDGGDLVFFTGSAQEMMVTFSRIGRRTGVVAHFTEVKR